MNTLQSPKSLTNDAPGMIGHPYVLPFAAIGMKDVARAGGKNASLGEMTQALAPSIVGDALGVRIPEGFAVTTDAFRDFLAMNNLQSKIETLLKDLDRNSFSNLHAIGEH